MVEKRQSPAGSRFLVSWIIDSILVWPISVFLMLLVVMIMATFFAPTLPEPPIEQPDPILKLIIWAFAMFMMMLGAVGLAIGFLQKRLVQHHFGVTLRWWRRASFIGGLVSLPMMYGAIFMLSDVLHPHTLSMLTMSLFMLFVSSIQWMSLRRHVRSAWLWLLANFAGGLIFSIILTNPIIAPEFLRWLVAVIFQGAITGISMRSLLSKQLVDNDPEPPKSGKIPIE